MIKYLLIILALVIVPTVQARGSSVHISTPHIAAPHITTPRVTTPKVTAPKTTTAKPRTNNTTVNHYYSSEPSYNPFGSNFILWYMLFSHNNQPTTVVQAGGQVQAPVCNKQWWEFWRMFEKC